MKINSFNQNFGANIIKNTTYNNAFENAQRANKVGCFSQTIEFINAVQAIQNTDKFDTFEIQQKGSEVMPTGCLPDEFFEIKIDGKPYKFKDIEYRSLFGNRYDSAVTAGIMSFAQEYLGVDIEKYQPTKKYQAYAQITTNLMHKKEEVKELTKEANIAHRELIGEFEQKLNELA